MRLETLMVLGCCGGYTEDNVGRLEEALSPVCVDETVIMLESAALGGRAAYELLSFASEVSKRVAVIAPQHLFQEAARLAASLSSPNVEVAAVLDRRGMDLEGITSTIATAYDRGVDSIALYIVYDYASAVEGIVERIEKATGVRVSARIGPPPFEAEEPPSGLRNMFSSIGLPFGLIYGLRGRRAVTQHGLRVTLLEPPCPRQCRRLSLTPKGVTKCPFRVDNGYVAFGDLTPERLETLAAEPCSRRSQAGQPEIRVRISIDVAGVEIPTDILELLAAVRMTKSLRGACKALGYDHVNMIAKLRRLERRLGRRLVVGYRGGAGGGYTVLTELGEKVVKKYLRAWARLEG